MKIKLLQIGKTQPEYLVEGVALFENRIRNYIGFSSEIIPALKLPGSAGPELIKQKEGELILSKLKSDDRMILLDEKGKMFGSVEFADFLQKQMNQGIRQIVFVIGGAYGFSAEVYEKAAFKISLSPMTFSHQMIRLLFLEQLYRAMTIQNNHPYHNE